jgi:hypothetical protein
MRTGTTVPQEAAGPLPDFAPVPRRYRHDGWTPERQKAFIAALADTGCVDRAARMVNIAQANAYALRRAPGAEAFRRAWDAALDLGVKRLKDIAFQRAIEGELVPVFVAGKLMGFRRKYNDKLLMFCLRHYGQDAQGRRTTINYFSARASAEVGIAAGGTRASAAAQMSATTLRTRIGGPGGGGAQGDGGAARDDAAAAVLGSFAGVTLDGEAQAQIMAALEACAARAREADAATGPALTAAALDDPDEPFVRIGERDSPYHGALLPAVGIEEHAPFREDEADWRLAGAERPDWESWTGAEEAAES